jgi:hypothetical protein
VISAKTRLKRMISDHIFIHCTRARQVWALLHFHLQERAHKLLAHQRIAGIAGIGKRNRSRDRRADVRKGN